MKKLNLIKEFIIINVGIILVAAAVFFFLMASHLSVGSISGIAIVLGNFVPLSVSSLVMIFNIVLLIAGFFLLGSEFGIKTVYSSLMLPVYMGMFERMYPENASLTGEPFIDMVAYCLVLSLGQAILFNRNASSGGLDIIAKILNKYFRIELGTAMSLAGMCVALSSAAVYDTKTVVISVIGTYLNGIVLDHFIFGSTMKKRVCIISQKEKEIREFILHELHSGATLYHAYGAYDEKPYKEIITIVDKNEYVKLMNFVTEIDKAAFVTVYAVNEIIYRPKK
jgi:uncharacterized membrane-anchored protein YitT (DUF2179 family)